MTLEHFDVLVVGAGLSGIGAAVHLHKHCPERSFAILEGRERLGGTWDLFRYPGIRSDSDMYTLGYSFKPWEQPKAIADGPSILKYVQDTAREHDIERHIRYGLQVKRAAWSTPDAAWTVEAERAGTNEIVRFTLQLPLHVQRLLPLRRRLPAALRRQRALRRAHRAPAALARGARLRRQARASSSAAAPPR